MIIKYFREAKKRYKKNKEERIYRKRVDGIKKQLKNCGENLDVWGDVELAYPEKISIGNECKLNHHVYLNGRSAILIGDDVTVSYGAKIISTGYDLDIWVKEGVKKHFEDKPIIIGNHCWIGAGAIILPGVKITGEYVVVAAGAIVTKDIEESHVILAGSPAKVVKKLTI